MADSTVGWVSDQLHEILGLSDTYTAEFLVGLAKKAQSPEVYVRKLQDTGAIAVNDAVRTFAEELWRKVPHKQVTEKPARAKEREILMQQARNRSYRLLSDPDVEDTPTAARSGARAGGKNRPSKRKNLRREKASAWESESEDESTVVKKGKGGDSDSDEWERSEML